MPKPLLSDNVQAIVDRDWSR